MSRSSLLCVLLVACAVGCSVRRLSGESLDRVSRPAFISRLEEAAGPRSLVFERDGAYQAKLKKLSAAEADRRLQAKLAGAMTRFELAERLRAQTAARLPQSPPWTRGVEPARVASVLETFLVEERPAAPPDYNLLVPLGADAVVEFVVQEYGMRSERGVAGAYVVGYARMFRLAPGREELWRRPFRRDRVAEGAEHLDPFRVGKEPSLFAEQVRALLDELAAQLAEDLTPPDRPAAAPAPAAEPLPPPAAPAPKPPPPPPPADELPPGELPDPD